MCRYIEGISMLERRKQEKIKALLQRAYTLGFEVGYYRHYESVGWVKRELRKIEETANRLGVRERALEVYRKGKTDGERKRSILLIGGERLPERVRGERRAFTMEARRTPLSRIAIFWRAHTRPRLMNLPNFLRRRNQF